MCLYSAEFRYQTRADRRNPRTRQRIAKTVAPHLHEKIMQTLGEGDGFFPLPGMRGPDAGERFRASPEVKYERLVQQLRKVSEVLEFPKLLIFFTRTRGRKKDITGPLVWRFNEFLHLGRSFYLETSAHNSRFQSPIHWKITTLRLHASCRLNGTIVAHNPETFKGFSRSKQVQTYGGAACLSWKVRVAWRNIPNSEEKTHVLSRLFL